LDRRSCEKLEGDLSIMKKTSLAAFLVITMQFAGCSQKSETNQVQAAVESKTAPGTMTNVEVYRKVAEQGDAKAQLKLGDMYYAGHEVPQDYSEAVRWYRKAAEQGEAAAQFYLGLNYEQGRGVQQNYAEALRWYRKAAEQGEARSELNLGAMYSAGNGVPQDYAAAADWYRKAAEQGEATAKFNLGVVYGSVGRGVPLDYVEAYKWLSLVVSSSSGDDKQKSDAARARDLVAGQLTTQQLAEAQRRAREWKPKSSQGKGGPPMKATTAQTPTNSGAKTEAYEQVDVDALSIHCVTGIASVVRNADGSLGNVDAIVRTLTVAGKPIDLITEKITQEGADAFILTKNLGKIKIKFSSAGLGSTLWLTASQKQMVKDMAN
jgi:TPR repeat protein